jgi:hypothetical protein
VGESGGDVRIEITGKTKKIRDGYLDVDQWSMGRREQ